MGQNAEVMPRPLNLSIVIHSLEVRTIFSLFVLKKHMLGLAQIISVFRTGWRFARVGVGYHLALFSLRTESDNPDATCELSP